MDKSKELLLEAGHRIDLLSENLPTRIDAASLSLVSKLPLKALTYREASLWRCEELARSAYVSFAQGDVVAGIVLTRAFTETVSGVWYLMELVDRQVESGVEPDLDDRLMRLLLGHRNRDDFPDAINVVTCLTRMDKRIPGILQAYATMSEYAHPNWSGTAFAYSSLDRENMVTELGRDSARTRSHDVTGLNCLNGGLGLLEFAYNKLSELFAPFIVACEKNLATKGDIDGPPTPEEPKPIEV